MRTRSSGIVVELSTTPRRRRNKKHSQQVDPTIVEKPVVTMADTRTMAELLQAPTEGYGDAIVIPAILAENFELKHGLLNLVTSKQFCGFEKEDPHAHIRWFNKITSTIKYKDVPNSSIKLMLFPRKFAIHKNRPVIAKVSTNTSTSGLSPDVAALTDAIKPLLLKNTTPPPASVKAVEESYQDNIQAYVFAAIVNYNEGNAGHRPPSVAHQVRPSGFPPVQNNQNQGNNYNPGNSTYRAPTPPTQAAPSNELANYMKVNDTNMRAMQNQITNMKTELKNEFQATMLQQNNKLENMLSNYFQMNKPPSSGPLPSNTVANPKGDLKAITTRSGVSYDGPPIPPPFSSSPKVVEREPEVTKDPVQPSTEKVQPPDVPTQAPTSEPVNAPKPKPNLPYPSRLNNQKLRERDDHQMMKFLQIFRSLHFILLQDVESINQIDVIDIACKEYSQEVLGISDNSESGNPTPIFEPIIAKSSPFLTPFKGGDFILEEIEACFASDSVPPRIDDAEFDPEGNIRLIEEMLNKDPYSPLPPKDLKCEELKSVKSSVDEPRSLNSRTYLLISIIKKEVVKLLDAGLIYLISDSLWVSPVHYVPKRGGMTVVTNEDNKIRIEEIEAYLASDSVPPEFKDAEFNPEGDIRLIEEMLNKDLYSPLPSKDLKCEELKSVKSSVDEPPELELKDLPSHLEYAFLKGTNKLPIIIAKNLKDEEKECLIKVLKSYKQAIAWKLFDVKGIDP
ncbi:hypothetical protein Tco_0867959 [Tanacetum coccineum]